jgi:hypothetical protein
VDCTTNSYAHHRPIPPWTARTARRDIARGRIYSRLGRGPGGATDLHAARPTRGPHHCREVPRKDDTTATFSLQLERAKWTENSGSSHVWNSQKRPHGRTVHCWLATMYCRYGLYLLYAGRRGTVGHRRRVRARRVVRQKLPTLGSWTPRCSPSSVIYHCAT